MPPLPPACNFSRLDVHAALLRLLVLVSIAPLLCACGPRLRPRTIEHVAAATSCVPTGTWVVPVTRERLTTPQAIERAATYRIVLLGEAHDRPEHHLWELQTIAALHGHRQSVVIGLEMFPRSAQPVLDQWVAGTLDERQFLTDGDWAAFWRFSPDLYLPIFRFARLNRIPMVALNVSPALVARVAEEGWDQVPPDQREGISEPAPAGPGYEASLMKTFKEHVGNVDAGPHADLSRFIAAQLLWDRAFAEALHAAAEREPDALVIGVMGAGHLLHGYGVPRQLAALGIDDVTVLLPWSGTDDCADLLPDVADAVFGVEATASRPRPLLGIEIEPAEGGVAVKRVSPGSIAATAGLRDGDMIVEAAGTTLRAPGDLREIVGRQAPGTWLPLRVRRGHDELEIVARFPSES